MARVLLTGGRGFIGTNLKRELRSRSHDVWTCDILPGSDPQHRRVDTSSYQQLDSLFREREFDFVYHLAAEYGRWNGEAHYENLWTTNVVGTKHMLRLQEQHRFRMIFFSSAEVYADYDQLMTEDVPDRVPLRPMNDYALSKWVGEQQCMNHADMFGTETVRVRPVGCYGPHEYYSPQRGVIPVFVHKALKGEPFIVHRGHQRVFDYVDDTCFTFANIIERFSPGEVYNVGGNENEATSIEALARVVLETTGAAPDLAKYRDQEEFTTRIKNVDSSKARRMLGHSPRIGLEEGIRRYVEWARPTY